jgi:hypothetical protein
MKDCMATFEEWVDKLLFQVPATFSRICSRFCVISNTQCYASSVVMFVERVERVDRIPISVFILPHSQMNFFRTLLESNAPFRYSNLFCQLRIVPLICTSLTIRREGTYHVTCGERVTIAREHVFKGDVAGCLKWYFVSEELKIITSRLPMWCPSHRDCASTT